MEGTLAVGGATVELARHLDRLSPFGHGNEEPAFVLPRARVVRADRIGREGNTMRAWLEGEGGGPRLKALLFRAGEGPLARRAAGAAARRCTWPAICGPRSGTAQ